VVVGPDEAPVPGLYAAGETACVSVHGANRLGTNSLLDIVVFGRRGGAHLAAFAADAELAPADDDPEHDLDTRLQGLLSGTGSDSVADIRAELQEQMFDLAGVVRREDGLRKMQDLLAGLHDRYERVVVMDKGKVFNTELMEAVELGFLLDLSDTLVAAALARDESRGAHYREDHPLRDDDHWLKHSLSYRESDGGVRLEYKDVKMGPYIPMERKY